VQFEPIEPPNRGLSPLYHPLEHFVVVDTAVVAGLEVGGIHEVDAPALAKATKFQEQHHRNGYPAFKFYETVVGHQGWETIRQMFLHIMVVVVLEIGEGTKVEQYEYRNYLRVGQRCFTIPLRLSIT